MMKSTKHIAPCADFELIAEQSIYVEWRPVTLNLGDVQALMTQIKAIYGTQPYCYLMNIQKLKGAPKQVRDFFNSEEFNTYCKAMAILSGSVLSKMLGNLFLSFNKLPYAAKMFSDSEKAMHWLNTQQEELGERY